MTALECLQKMIRDALTDTSMTDLSKQANIPRRSIYAVLEGCAPTINRAEQLCNALSIEFYIGPRRYYQNLNETPFNSEKKVSEIAPTYAFDPRIDGAEHILIPKLEVKAAAGPGTVVDGERPIGMLAFRREWMRKHNIQPGQVSAIEVKGDSMQPGLQDGDTILVDHQRVQVRRGAVMAARVGNDLFVKRLEQTPNGEWLLQSDNHEYAPLALGTDDAVIGEVVWRGRWLV